MDAIKVTNFRKILVKKPFFELTPKGYMTHDGYCRNEVSDNEDPQMPQDTLYRVVKTQKDFLREFYPTSHKIFDKDLYPDIWRKNPEDGNGMSRRFKERHLLSSRLFIRNTFYT